MKEEKLLKARCGTKNPFHVPEGYFEQFTDRMMAQLPEQPAATTPAVNPTAKRISFYTRVKPYLYLAAMFCGLLFGVQVFKYQHDRIMTNTETLAAQQNTQAQQDKYIDDLCDYANISHADVYAYVTSGYSDLD